MCPLSPRCIGLALRLLALGLAIYVFPGPAAVEAQASLSPRNANYTLDVRVDTDAGTLTGLQRLVWRNIQDQPTSELWFHLYWNGWRNNQSTWLLEDRIRGRSTAGKTLKAEDWGYQIIEKARWLDPEGPVDLTASLRFAAPDDGNPEDRTVMVLDLPRPVAPGETIEVELEFRARVPRTFARTGRVGDFYFVAHWFPKLGVFEGAEGWNCHQFHSATEFYSDYGNYDVRLTLPQRYVVGATGREVETEAHGDGTASHRFVQEDVHGFAWTASPDYLERRETFEEPGLPPVEIRLLLQPEHERQAERHLEATRAALKFYGLWYGPYPYGHITVVDPAWGSGAGGMEYPTLFTCGTRLLSPAGTGSPEGVTIHEAGHQFWYGMVGNNEFEHAWIDEGLNTFSTARTYYAAFDPPVYTQRYLGMPGARGGFLPWKFDEVPMNRAVHGNRLDRYRRDATSDTPSTPTFHYYPSTASSITYSKTAVWLHTLERYLGWETLQEILSTFFERWKFRHPEPEDFFAVANEVAGQDLTWFFDQVYGGSQTFDYGIERMVSRPFRAEGLFEAEDGSLEYRGKGDSSSDGGEKTEEPKEKLFRTEVTVRRYGDGTFPVEVLLVFEDGTEVRRAWDGQDRWTLLVEERNTKLRHAVVDPERILLLDLNFTNNSRLLESQARFPAIKWGSRWLFWAQDLLHVFSFFG
jgi:hypothetical protein